MCIVQILAKKDHVHFGGGKACFCFQVEPDDMSLTSTIRRCLGARRAGEATNTAVDDALFGIAIFDRVISKEDCLVLNIIKDKHWNNNERPVVRSLILFPSSRLYWFLMSFRCYPHSFHNLTRDLSWTLRKLLNVCRSRVQIVDGQYSNCTDTKDTRKSSFLGIGLHAHVGGCGRKLNLEEGR